MKHIIAKILSTIVIVGATFANFWWAITVDKWYPPETVYWAHKLSFVLWTVLVFWGLIGFCFWLWMED